MAKSAAKSKAPKGKAKAKAKKAARKAQGRPQRPTQLQMARTDASSRFKKTGAAHLSVNGKPPVEFPIYAPVEGPSVIDISKLYASTGHFTFDPGFMSTASCDW